MISVLTKGSTLPGRPCQDEDVALLRYLPAHHKDPFDRMLIVQSISNQYPIMTDDVKFGKYDCTII